MVSRPTCPGNMPKKVILIGAETLRTKCPTLPLHKIKELLEISAGGSGYTLDELLLDMHQTMVAENGMGLAANQIGWILKIFIMKNEQSYNEYINPEILSQEDLVDFENEACLSIPGTSSKTKRFRKIKLRWQDRLGATYESDFEGVPAFAIQHEVDHLEGKLYVDQLNATARFLVLKKHKKYLQIQRR